MYVLYGNPGSGSASVEAALLETGAAFELRTIVIANGDLHTEEFGKINPRRQLPALQLPDGSVMTEGVAMMLHLADAFPQSLLAPPPGSSARAQHDRWLVFMVVNIYEGELRHFYPDRYSTAPDAAGGVEQAAIAYVHRHYRMIEAAIGDGPWFFGDQMTMVDLYLWMLSAWCDQAFLAAECPKVAAIAARVAARPKIAPIHAIHNGG